MKFSNKIDINDVFNRIAKGDDIAFKVLYDACYQTVFAIAFSYGPNREFANDVVQEIFLKIWERRSELADIENPEGWLTNAAKFQMLTALKKELSKREYLSKFQRLQGEVADPEHLLINRQREAVIEKAISCLPARQAEIYRLSREEGLTYQQIAEKLKIGRETVKEHITRALRSIYSVLLQHKDLLRILNIIFL